MMMVAEAATWQADEANGTDNIVAYTKEKHQQNYR